MKTCVVLHVFLCVVMFYPTVATCEEPIAIGDRREPLLDDYLIERLEGAELQLQRPVPREVVIVHDQPWEGNICAYHTVFQDDDRYRLYYRGGHYDEQQKEQTHEQLYCYAESKDGIHWTKPQLGIHEFRGSRENNIVIKGLGSHNFAPFRDRNPKCSDDARYKAVGNGPGGMHAFKSADGIRWSPLTEAPIITDGAFDSQNLTFWDVSRGRYVDFHRDFRDGVRDIKTCTSEDFLDWTAPVWISYRGAPPEHLYTNAITVCPGVPHIFVGFPKRFIPSRNPAKHPYPGVSDGVLMTSRDGINFFRWPEAFLRPGPQPDRWVNRNNMIVWGIVTTSADQPGAPDEWSIYATEGYYRGDAVRLRRFTVRQDGFVSVHAPAAGGQLVTRPITFSATSDQTALTVNYATSAAGSVRCEIQDVAGNPLTGFSLKECDELYGDEVSRGITWQGRGEVGELSGRPLRLRFELKDADLYAIQFQ